MKLPDGKAAAPQVREHEQLEQLDRRVAALRVPARVGAMGRDRRRQQPTLVPQVKLPRSEARHRGDLPRAVGSFQTHQPQLASLGYCEASRSAVAAPAKSLSVRPPSLCVEYVSVTRL